MDSRALVVAEPGRLTVETRPTAAPRPYEALVAVAYGGICGSDLHYWKNGQVGESVLRSPMVLGHEIVGVVAAPAADGSGPALGDRVAVHPAQVCGRCGYCRRGEENLCTALRYLGSAARVPHTDGGFAEHLVVPASRLVPIPGGLGLRTAALAEPASVVLHGLGRVRRLGRRVEDADVLVTGAGPIGLLAVALAVASGARTVTATDVFDHPLRVALQVGAAQAVHADAETGVPAADIAIESSGSPRAFAAALRALRPGGVLVNVGHLPSGGVTAPLHLTVTRELTVTGSSRFYGEMPEALSIMDRDAGRFAPIVTSVFALDDAVAAFQEAADAARSSKVLLSFTAPGQPVDESGRR
ncbi:alcohol dehydrogenase catalytic domain-containing protein [Actinomadura sp. DC4]|uniref:alcohol dehydrogenase catalytic domain-containing protein n=1 Tax=Actinomadura sp. DC4 TaxID=3055069 RepID=UPI0025B00DA8|nr:alcohol dehydrogenase catalytic domain-containing protein [Actinomadura sp. DC4]MDN3353659.1 alcohol dehydrogenase catalytic domain-containing protein [Actinomadura sp. DC4]